MSGITESVVEEACLDSSARSGYATAYGPTSAPTVARGAVVVGGRGPRRPPARRGRADQPGLPHDAVDQVVARVLRAESQNALAENLRVHRLVTDGVAVEHRAADGSIRTRSRGSSTSSTRSTTTGSP